MSGGEVNEADWICIRVEKALEKAPVGEGTASALKVAISDHMTNRKLPAGELLEIVKELLSTLDGNGK